MTDVDGLRRWLGERHGIRAMCAVPRREVGTTVKLVTFGASDGTSFAADCLDDPAGTIEALRLVAGSGHLYAHGATATALVVRRGLNIRLRGLRCTRVMALSIDMARVLGDSIRDAKPKLAGRGDLLDLCPAVAAAVAGLGRHWERVAGRSATTGGPGSWLTTALTELPTTDPMLRSYQKCCAVETARLVDELRARATPDQKQLALTDMAVEDLFCWRTDHGIAVDEVELARQLDQVEAERRQGTRALGIDLTRDNDETRAWLTEHDIHITNQDGRPSLSHHDWAAAHCPPEAAEAFENFRRVRTAARNGPKLKEITDHLIAGRVHPRLHAIGAVTARMSGEDPAVQNLPRSVRPVFRVDAGHTLVSLDLDRVEVCVLAGITGDEALMAAVASGRDPYMELAVSIWGAPARGDIDRREVAKTALLAMIYGEGTRALAHQLGVTVEAAQKIRFEVEKAYPVAAKWAAEQRRAAKAGEMLVSQFGRRLIDSRNKPHRAVNHMVQSAAADLFKPGMLRTAALLPRDSLWLPVHDELVVQVPVGQEQEAARALREGMATELGGVTISGQPEIIGSAWVKAGSPAA